MKFLHRLRTYLRAVPYTFYSKGLYRDVASNWPGIGALYLFVMIALCFIPISFVKSQATKAYFESEIVPVIKRLPDMAISQGRLSIDARSPYIIRGQQSDDVLAVIDARAKPQTLLEAGAPVLITQRKVQFKRPGQDDVSEVDLSQIPDAQLTRVEFRQMADTINRYLFPWIYFSLMSQGFLYQLLQSFVIAACGMLMLWIWGKSHRYISMVRLANVSVTPTLILTMLFEVLGWQFPLKGVIALCFLIGYFTFATRSIVSD